MKWKQFFTPVTSINWEQAHQLVEDSSQEDVIFLDVRQPSEYNSGHMPGAKLLPLGDIDQKLSELDQNKHIVIYWASGGRSRVAAQMLSGKGYEKIYNLSGGIKAWQNEVAVGPDDTGLFLFDADLDAETVIITGFGLEMGLREFYLSMMEKVNSESTKNIFSKLAEIELLHQQQLLGLYEEVSGEKYGLEAFSEKVVSPAMEGGLTTEEYLERYSVDFEEEIEVLGLALAIEAQALDLYLRASEKSKSAQARKVLKKIADEERQHIAYLGNYIDEFQPA